MLNKRIEWTEHVRRLNGILKKVLVEKIDGENLGAIFDNAG